MAIPVLTLEQMREWEQATWAAGIKEEAVIQRVGERLAQRILTLTKPGDAVLTLDAAAERPSEHVLEVASGTLTFGEILGEGGTAFSRYGASL